MSREEAVAFLDEDWTHATLEQIEALPPYLRRWVKSNMPRESVEVHVSSVGFDGDMPTPEDITRLDENLTIMDHVYARTSPTIVNNFTSGYYNKDEGEFVRTQRGQRVKAIAESNVIGLERRDGMLKAADRYLSDTSTRVVEPAHKALQFKLRENSLAIARATTDKERKRLEYRAKRMIGEFYRWLDTENVALVNKAVLNMPDGQRQTWRARLDEWEEASENAEDEESYEAYREITQALLSEFVFTFGQPDGWLVRPEHLATMPTQRR